MLEMLRQVTETNRQQADLFATLLKAWTSPIPQAHDYQASLDTELLTDLRKAADAGDEDALLILGDERLKHDYLSNFR